MPTYPQTSFAVPPGAMQLTLVRHGQSQAIDPAVGIALKHGHGDPPLTDLGHQQAAAVAERLADESIDALFVSSLTRTHETAAPLADRMTVEPTEEHDLREVFLGDWEGGSFRHHMHLQEHPGAIEFRRTYEWGHVPGAETNDQLTARTSGVIHRLFESHRDQHIVSFVHGGVIAALCSYAVGAHMRGFAGSDNAAIHRLVVTDDRWFLRSFNDTNHLGAVATPAAEITQHA